MQISRVSILGLGLIGGSIAKALKSSGKKIEIGAFDKKKNVLNRSLGEGVIDSVLDSIKDSVNSDLIILSMPADKSLDAFKTLLPLLTRSNIITDVCGVKNIFEDTRNTIDSRGHYIGGHPMVGKEGAGYENSEAGLFADSTYIISSFAENCSRIKEFLAFVNLLGAAPVFLNPEKHDKIVAGLSHMPQLISVALMNSVEDKGKDNFLHLAGPGFHDMTRLSSSPFTSWKSILRYNREEIITAIEKLHYNLTKIEHYLECEDFESIEKMFTESKNRREKK